MSTIYKFQDSEGTLTATATATSTSGTGGSLLSTDSVLVYCNNPVKVQQVPIGSVAALGALQSITTSTASGFQTINPFGNSVITAASTGGVAILPAPPSKGIYKSIWLSSTSTSTGFQVIVTSSAVAVFTTGTSTNTIVPRQQILFGQNSAYIDLVSESTAAWAVTGWSQGTACIAFTTTTTT
jgi:hypothetical protein